MATEPISLAEARSRDPDLAAPRTVPGKIRTVLLATDLTAASEVATTQAIDLAASIHARLLIVNVIDQGPEGAGHVGPYEAVIRVDQQRANREGPLLSIVERARMAGVRAAFLLWTGEAGLGIVAAAEAENADLIVVGTRGLDREGRFLMGSVSEYVVYHSNLPVLVAH